MRATALLAATAASLLAVSADAADKLTLQLK